MTKTSSEIRKMSQSSRCKGKKRRQMNVTKTLSVGAGDALESQSVPKSRDPGKLEQFLKLVLHDDNIQNGKKGERPQRPKTRDYTLKSTKDIRQLIKNIIEYCTCQCSGEYTMEYLLNAARVCKILSNDFSDSLVDEAIASLPSLAYGYLATCLVQEAKQTLQTSTTCVISPFGATLLSEFRERSLQNFRTVNDEWKDFLAECKPGELPAIFKHLISIGVKQFISKASDVLSKEHFHPGLELVLVSEHSVDGLALLLKDEVEQAKDQPASFFSSTELGCLLAVNTVINRNRYLSLDGFISSLLGQIMTKKCLSGIAETVQAHVSRMIQAVTTALLNILKSHIVSHRQSVLTWMAAVINSNRHYEEDTEHQSHDAYLVTFCAVLLYMWKRFPGKQMKSVDFTHYSFSKSALNLETSKSSTGEPTALVSGRFCSNLTETQVVQELFFCCHGAVVVCLLPVLRRYCELGTPQLEKLEKAEYFKLLVRLEELTLWGNELIGLVAHLYEVLCDLLLQLLDTLKDHGNNEDEELVLNNICLIIVVFFADMTDWISLIREGKGFFDESILETCLYLCFRLIDWRYFSVMSSPNAAKNILRTLFNVGWFLDIDQWLMKEMEADIVQVPLSLLIIYTRKEFVDDYMVSRFVISLLNRFWHKAQFQRILHQNCEGRLLKEFLIAFLHKLQDLVGQCVSTLSESELKKHEHFEWLKHHVHMLCTLTGDNLIHPMLCLPPLYSHTHTTGRCVLDVLGNLETSGNWDSTHFQLTNNLKSLLGKILQTLLLTVGRALNTQTATSDLPVTCSQLKMIKEDPFFNNGSFTNLIQAINDAAFSYSENQGETRIADESWLAEQLSEPLDEDALLLTFHTHLRHVRLCTAFLLQSHSFEGIIKVTRLKPERKELIEWEMQRLKRTLPCNPSSAAFIVVDTERVDVMRCAMSGPVGTPYSRGLFVFDIFCPADYPSVPPMVKLVSYENGADVLDFYLETNGVSLASLRMTLGYRNRGDWSIQKILHMLRNMMLSAMKETTQRSVECTDGRSQRLCQVRAQTVRHAILEPLKNPFVGLEKVIGLYFALQQQALLKQCAEWVHDCVKDDEIKTSMFQDLQELRLFYNSQKELGKEI